MTTVALMTKTISFRPSEDDERIIDAAQDPGESRSDVIRRGLRLLEREVWVEQARKDTARLKDEDLSEEEDAW